MESQTNGSVGCDSPLASGSNGLPAPTSAATGKQETKVIILTRPKPKPDAPNTNTSNPSIAVNRNNSSIGNGNGNAKQIVKSPKTREQREQEYAEARQRILGDVRFLEEEREVEMENRLTPAEILKMKIQEALADDAKAKTPVAAGGGGTSTSNSNSKLEDPPSC